MQQEKEQQVKIEDIKLEDVENITAEFKQKLGYVSIPKPSKKKFNEMFKQFQSSFIQLGDSKEEIKTIQDLVTKYKLQHIQNGKSMRKVFLVYPERLHGQMQKISRQIGIEMNEYFKQEKFVYKYSTDNYNYWSLHLKDSKKKNIIISIINNLKTNIDNFINIYVFSARSGR